MLELVDTRPLSYKGKTTLGIDLFLNEDESKELILDRRQYATLLHQY
jgi:hypothetical protein